MQFFQTSLLALPLLFILSCKQDPLVEAGSHYQQFQDIRSLQYVVDNIEQGTDTTVLQSILGQGIDFGFDMRFLVDSTGPTGCAVGAVFHLDEGKVSDAWIGDICE